MCKVAWRNLHLLAVGLGGMLVMLLVMGVLVVGLVGQRGLETLRGYLRPWRARVRR